jgi:hypothetical protein
LSTNVPGAGKYNPEVKLTTRRELGTKIYAAKPDKERPKGKVGPGAYNEADSYLGLKRRPRRQAMSKSAEREIFYMKEKRQVPGVGNYSLDASFKIYKGPSRR